MKNLKEYAGQLAAGFERIVAVKTEEERLQMWANLADLHAEARQSYTESEIAAGIYEERNGVSA